MSGYRFFNPAPVFLDLLGLKPVAGGNLYFYDHGTTTPKDTWSDSDLTVENTNPVPLDSAGRSNVNIWLDGAYSVVMKDASGAEIWTRDVDSGADAGATIPPLLTGRFLTNDGSNLIWQELLQIPDPTDSANDILSTDGSNLIWIAKPSTPDLPVENFSNRVVIGTMMIQWGSSSAPASGNRQTATSVTFANAFSGTPYHVDVTPTNVTHTAGGQIGVKAVTARSSSGFSVQFDSDDFGQSNASFIGAVPFTWIAFGPTTA